MTLPSNTQLKIMLMREQMKADRERSLAIHHAKFGPKEYVWEADYGDGIKKHTSPVEYTEAEKSESIFDNTLRDLPVNLYLDAKEWERGEYDKYEAPVFAMDYLFMMSFTYHFATLVLPLALFIFFIFST